MADVAATLAGWSSTTGSNAPSGATSIGTGLDDNLREIQGVIVRGLSHKGADIASATTTDIGAVEGLAHDITGTTTITGLGTVRAGIWKVLKFEGALTFTHNATSLILPGGANITTADGDIAVMISEGSGNWRCVAYQKATGKTVIGPAVGDITGLGTGVSTALAIAANSAGGFLTNGSEGTSGQGNQSFRRLVAYPQSSTTFTVTAQECVTRNPTSGITRRLGSVSVTSSDLSAAQGASAANGRDQSGTFSAGVIFCYVISGEGQTDALLFSTSETAPTLPTDYTEWAIVGPFRWGGSSIDENYRYRGSVCRIDGGYNALTGGTATTETSVSLSGYAGANTEEFLISGTGTCTADGSANYDIALSLRSASGINATVWGTPYKAASAGAGSMPTWMGREAWITNINGSASIYYQHTVTVGSSPSTNLVLRAFRYPNGAN